MNEKAALTHLVKAARDAIHLENVLSEMGYKETPYFDLYGEISEAIYCLLNEQTESFSDSETYNAIHDSYTPDEACADRLMDIYRSNASNADLGLSRASMEVFEEVANERGISIPQLQKLILCEWSARQVIIREFT
jgi:hypothetical protein